MAVMLKTLLFDLDDTLLGNDIPAFLPHYLPRLARHAAPLIDRPAGDFIKNILEATEATIRNLDLNRTNDDIFGLK